MENSPLSVTEFVAYLNQTLEYAYPNVLVKGELTDFRVSKNRWVYFNLKDESSSVKCFGTVYQLPGPLEEGMMVQVLASPRLHNLYGFSLNVQAVQPVGQGSLRKAFDLLKSKLQAEGLFNQERKTALPHLPDHIGLISSTQAAGYIDFLTILNARWGGITIDVADCQVQGLQSPRMITKAINYFNSLDADDRPELIVIVRGGGSADDLAAFNDEQLVRAVANSKLPVLTGIGHEIDTSLADLAADMRAATPSNAAERLTPDRRELIVQVNHVSGRLNELLAIRLADIRKRLSDFSVISLNAMTKSVDDRRKDIRQNLRLLRQFDPKAPLRRGYALLRRDGKVVGAGEMIVPGELVEIETNTVVAITEVKNASKK